MTQISRPLQIALVTAGLFVAVWFVVLRGHSTGSSSSSATGAAPAASSSPSAPGASTPVYHGAAPGIEGLTRAIAKAHGAVAESERNAAQLARKSQQASGSGSPAAVAGSSPAGAAAPTASGAASRGAPWASSWVRSHGPRSPHGVRPATASRPATATKPHKPGQSTRVATPALQLTVERELKQGSLVAILFWNPSAPVDQTVHQALATAATALGKSVHVHVALANQVGSFGSVTRSVGIYETPTIVLASRRGQTRTVTGLTDAYSIEQAIAEARHS